MRRGGNNRIRATYSLNQNCALSPDLDSILRAQVLKTLLQQYRPTTDIVSALGAAHLQSLA